jgi:hypothetical protein
MELMRLFLTLHAQVGNFCDFPLLQRFLDDFLSNTRTYSSYLQNVRDSMLGQTLYRLQVNEKFTFF